MDNNLQLVFVGACFEDLNSLGLAEVFILDGKTAVDLFVHLSSYEVELFDHRD